jgi:CDP-diacylglycerol--serine O-phosphatidyltransferase
MGNRGAARRKGEGGFIGFGSTASLVEQARMDLRKRLIDPRSPDHRPRRAAYVLPSLFTAGNIFLGYVAIIQAFHGAMAAITGVGDAPAHFEIAAKMIGVAVLLDGLDGRIARLTNTVSDFGREMDSLADVITFGIAPAVLAFAWGVRFIDVGGVPGLPEYLPKAGYFVCFLFVLCGAARLARFNVTTNPIPRNPGRPDRKYFVGLPIPSAAAMVAAVVFAAGCEPLRWWPFAVGWLVLLTMLSLLMVSMWRYPSFKDISLLKPRSPLTIIFIASLIYLIWVAAQPVLLCLAILYVGSGIVIRIGGILRRQVRRGPSPNPKPEQQVG